MPKARNSKVDEALALYRQGLKLIEILPEAGHPGGDCPPMEMHLTNGTPPKKPSARNLKNRTLANEEGSLVTRTPPGHPVTRTPRSSASCPSISQRRHWNCCT